MRSIIFLGELALFIIFMPLLIVLSVVYYIWDKYDNYKTARYFKKLKEKK